MVKFGRVDENSLVKGSLQPLAEVVTENEDVRIQHHCCFEMLKHFKRAVTIRVIREGQNVILTLVPRKNWGGRGMLGCVCRGIHCAFCLIDRLF